MKQLLTLLICLSVASAVAAQSNPGDRKFSPAELKEDLAYLKHLLLEVQANPFTEISKTSYDAIFNDLEGRLTDSLTATDFFKMVRPTASWLSDEHARISLPQPSTTYRDGYIFFPISLVKKGNNYVIDTMLYDDLGLLKGDVVTHINKLPVEQVVQRCSEYTTGYPDQRLQKAAKQVGYLYGLATPPQTKFIVTRNGNEDITVPGTRMEAWTSYLNPRRRSGKPSCPELINYHKYGDTGYIDACSFSVGNDSAMAVLEARVRDIFKQIKKDKVERLIVDVSRNSGGNSAVGDMLIDYFYGKPYWGYQCNWKRSEDYRKKMEEWGMKDEMYNNAKPGETLHFDPSRNEPSKKNPLRFNKKVYVMVGEGTFSSAVMFATIVKDNHIATLIGQTPSDGHPTHFGEMFGASLPHSALPVQFGVKEWIRPAGKVGKNLLIPDIQLEDREMNNLELLLGKIK